MYVCIYPSLSLSIYIYIYTCVYIAARKEITFIKDVDGELMEGAVSYNDHLWV